MPHDLFSPRLFEVRSGQTFWVLCSTTGLKGKKVTCFHSIKDDVTNAGGTYVDQEVCIDGNIITSRTPDDLPAFVVAIIERMRNG